MTCPTSLSPEALLDWWVGELTASEADALEEHVFGCEDCAGRLAEIEALAASVRRLTEAGRFRAVVVPSLVDRLAARGLRVRTYRARVGETIPCGAAPGDQLLVSRVAVDLRGVKRLDLAMCDERWQERLRLTDVPFDAAHGEVVFAERVDSPEVKVANVLRFRLLAVEEGGDRELARYALAHDPRGPPA
jgi:anti-sigma factor RsiW